MQSRATKAVNQFAGLTQALGFAFVLSVSISDLEARSRSGDEGACYLWDYPNPDAVLRKSKVINSMLTPKDNKNEGPEGVNRPGTLVRRWWVQRFSESSCSRSLAGRVGLFPSHIVPIFFVIIRDGFARLFDQTEFEMFVVFVAETKTLRGGFAALTGAFFGDG